MIEGRENLVLDAYDLNGNKLCNLYDNKIDTSGQAMNVVVMKERNGWKEQSFDLPGVMETNSGKEKNHRVDYLVAEHRIRLLDDDGEDWYILSEPKVNHTGKAKKYSVTAGHISQLLKTKNLGLEFSDEEGNNTGTIRQLVTTILEGTGWQVGDCEEFYEDDGSTTKIRSLVASKKTGAFSLIAKACELFDAKPEYVYIEGGGKYVNIKHLNPFERPEKGAVPDKANNENTVELHYGHALKNVTRTLNSEDMITKMYAYGSYMDKTSGYCAISEVAHVEYTYAFRIDIPAGTEARIYYAVTDSQNNVVRKYVYFIAKETIPQGSRVEFSRLDPTSKMYVWDIEHELALPVTEEPQTNVWTTEANAERNRSPYEHEAGEPDDDPRKTETLSKRFYGDFITDFTYYQDNGMLTDEQLQTIAEYQHQSPELRKTIMDMSAVLNEDTTALSEIVGSIDYCKLDVRNVTNDNGYQKIVLGDDKVLYRTDYAKTPKKQFRWFTAKGQKANGDPTEDPASIVYIIKSTRPSEHDADVWVKGYLKSINPTQNGTYDTSVPGDLSGVDSITLWQSNDTQYGPGQNITANDKFYLFRVYTLNGKLGSLEATDESVLSSLESTLKDVTVQHKVEFGETVPSGNPNLTDYGWFWQYNKSGMVSKSILYFYYKAEDDRVWQRVWYSSGNLSATTDSVQAGHYWYNWQEKTLKKCITSGSTRKWKPLESTDDVRIAKLFGTIYEMGWTRDQLYKGIYEKSALRVASGWPELVNNALPVGSYAIYNGYYKYYLFTTTNAVGSLPIGTDLIYDKEQDTITINKNNNTAVSVVEVNNIRPDAAKYHPANIMKGMQYQKGTINSGTGNDTKNDQYERSGYISVVPNTSYKVDVPDEFVSDGMHIYRYGENKEYIGHDRIMSSNDTFITSTGLADKKIDDNTTERVRMMTKYIRISYRGSLKGCKIHAVDYKDYLVVNDVSYRILNNPNASTTSMTNYDNSELLGITHLLSKFVELSDKTFTQDQPAVLDAQEDLKIMDAGLAQSLGDIQKEGYWEDDSYVDGDEEKLYYDAIKNLKQISKPKATYKIDYLHLNGSQEDSGHWSSEVINNSLWPQLTIDSAIHLVDPDIDVNIWAYVDKVKKCYDQPWKTTVDINTDLSTIGQKSFTDVMTQIAQVANHAKNSLGIYDRSKAFGQGSVLDTDFLEGKISANKLLIEGGSSTWSTNNRGNMVFVSSDGTSAMTLTGNGFAIANTKNDDGDWNWRTFGTGDGFTADEITAGTIDAERINVVNLNADNINTGTINGFMVGEGTITTGSLSEEITIELSKGGDALTLVGSRPETWGPNDTVVEKINAANALAQSASDLAGSATRTHIGDSADSNPMPGDIWIDTSNGSVIKYYNETTGEWDEADVVAAAEAAAQAAAAATSASEAATAASGAQTAVAGQQTAVQTAQDTANQAASDAEDAKYSSLAANAAASAAANDAQAAANAAQAAEQNAYTASSTKNTIRYYWADKSDPEYQDYFIGKNDSYRPKAGDVCIRADEGGNIYVYSGNDAQDQYDFHNWVLTKPNTDRVIGTSIDIDAEAGTIDILANSTLSMASNQKLAMTSGQVEISGGSVNIGATDGVNIASTGSVNIAGGTISQTGGEINFDGGTINFESGEMDVTTGTFNMGAADIIIGAKTLKIESAGATLDEWLSASGRNYIENSAAVNGTFSWGVTNGTLTSGEAGNMVASITQAPDSYKKLVTDGKTVFKLTRDDSQTMPFNNYAYCKLLDKKFTEGGTYTWQIKLFVLSSYVDQLCADSDDGDYVQLIQQYRKPSQSSGNNNTFISDFALVNCYKKVNTPDVSKFELKPGWNTITRTFQLPADQVNQADADYCRFFVVQTNKSNRSYSMQFTDLKLERGSVATYWTPAPEDGDPRFAMAWTDIDQDMNKISMRATKLTNDSMNSESLLLTSNEFRVDYNNEVVMSLKENEATFNVDTMKVNGHIDGDVVNTQNTDSYDVEQGNSGITELNKWIRSLGKTLNGNITINIQYPISGNIVLSGFKSAGNGDYGIIINFGKQTVNGTEYTGWLNGSITCWNCDKVTVQSSDSSPSAPHIMPKTAEQFGIDMENVGFANINNISVNMENATASSDLCCYRAARGTHMYLVNCNAAGCGANLQNVKSSYGYYATTGSVMSISGCKGGGAQQWGFSSAVRARNGSIVHVHGATCPMGGFTTFNGDATINQGTSMTATSFWDTGTYPVYPDPPVEYTKSAQRNSTSQTYGTSLKSSAAPPTGSISLEGEFSTDATQTLVSAQNSDGSIRCGKDTTGHWYGWWYFGNTLQTDISSTYAMSNISNATISLTRKTSGGTTAGNTAKVFWLKSAQSGAPSTKTAPSAYFDKSLYIGAYDFKPGEPKIITLNATQLSKLKNKSVYGIAVCGSGNNYLEFEQDSCDITLYFG